MRIQFLKSFSLLLLLGESLNAQALGTPGTISGITVSPTNIAAYTPATVSIAGFGECGQVLVSFGDGKDTTLTSVKFPRNVMHTWSKQGTLIVAVRPTQTCNAASAITTTIQVEGSALDLLCALSGCDDSNARSAPCTKPVIKQVVFTSPLEPTEQLIVSGCGFGDASSRGGHVLYLKGAFPNAGTSVPLQILTWSESAVMAKLPAMTGVKDQKAYLRIESEPNTSNEWPVDFRATRILQLLTVPLQEKCSTNAYDNVCMRGPQYGALHGNNSVNNAVSGVDVFTLTLGNGWVIQSHSENTSTWLWWVERYNNYNLYSVLHFDGGSHSNDLSGFVPGAGSGLIRVNWKTEGMSYEAYGGTIKVKGPIGVPQN
jgi:hypothetical protein